MTTGGGTFNNAGTFEKTGGTGTTNVFVPYTQTAGTTFIGSGSLAYSSTPMIKGGTISGAGTILGNYTGSVSTNPAGAIAPGTVGSTGSIALSGTGSGNYTSGTGAFDVKIGGTGAGQFDTLTATGTATLVGGTLNVTLINSFTPASGNSFTILTAASVTGTFATTNFPALPPGLIWHITYHPASVVLSVGPATLTSIAITAPSTSIAKGTTDQFTATGTFSDGSTSNITTQVSWNSSNTGTATIGLNTGLASGVGVGTSNITAKLGTVTSNTVVLTVTAATLTSIAITAPSTSIAKGTTDQFTATGTFSDGSTSNITTQVSWNSSNTGAATIGLNTGLASGVGVGTSNITAKLGSITSNTVVLTVTQATPLITWNNPANLDFGSALGSIQLDATANVPGTFVYNPPAGIVLLPGPNHPLSVTFTPVDTTNFTVGGDTALITINPVPTSGPAKIIVTSVLSRDSNTGNIVVLVTLANAGGSLARNVELTVAKIGSTVPTELPISSGDIASGTLAQTKLQFPGSIGITGTNTILTLNGTYTGGTFTITDRIQLP